MKFLVSMMLTRHVLRNVLLSFSNKGYNKINSRACSSYRKNIKCEVLCSKPHAVMNSAPCVRLVHHTNKGWKLEMKKRLNGNQQESEEQEACEEGTEAVHHHKLMSSLQHCSSVQEQIDKLCLELSLTTEDVENRKEFTRYLFDLLLPYFPNLQINLFGSSINGFGFKGCDCDVSIDVNDTDGDEARQLGKILSREDIPTVADVESGRVAVEDLADLPSRYLLRFVRRVFREHGKDIKEPILLIKARHSILRFYNEKYNLFCDFSLGNNSSLTNTRVIRFIGKLDDRVMALIKFLRYWGKHHGFIGDMEHFNSYAFSLIVVYFLQNTSPPVLPAISEMLEKSNYLITGRVGDDEQLLNDIKNFSPSKNTQTVGELLKEFFFYCLYNDFSQVLCPLTGSSIPKMELAGGPEPFEFSTIAVQDPFKESYNLSHAATEKYCKIFLKSVLEACKSYQDSGFWDPSPDNRWGLLTLLDSAIHDPPAQSKMELKHIIEIPIGTNTLGKLLKSGLDINDAKEMWFQKASKAVADIFEYGLLFECRTLKSRVPLLTFDETVKDLSGEHFDLYKCSKSIIKIECVAYHNVFSGRSNLRGLHAPSNTVNSRLEKEHLISQTICEAKKRKRKENAV